MILVLLGLTISSNAIALSAITVKTIQGSAPYLSFDRKGTKANSTEHLLSITLSDGRQYSIRNNPSSENNPIELPAVDQKLKDIKKFIPEGKSVVTLTDVVSTNKFWKDDDGDSSISVTGNLTMTVQNVDGKIVNENTELNACYSPYKITLTSDSGILSTQYGKPRSTEFKGGSVSYYLTPKVAVPYACFAQPTLRYNGNVLVSYRGPVEQWDDDKGFKPQDINSPASNFPTIGAKGMYFDLTVAGASAKELTYSKWPTDSNIDLSIKQGSRYNIARIELTGPSDSNKGQTSSVVPTYFNIYSDKAKTNVIYRFMISKWFVAKPTYSGGLEAAKAYCSSLGNGYRLPHIVEMTNANNDIVAWAGGLSGQPNNFQRRIGGGFFAEWGYTDNEYYVNSDFIRDDINFDYWTADPFYGGVQNYTVFSKQGNIGHYYFVHNETRVVCVR